MISVVIPVYNEAKNLQFLVERLLRVLKQQKQKFELVFIDDASTDNSLNSLLELKKRHSEIRVISFVLNMGQTYAFQRGFKEAKGDIIITMDADLQNLPEDIPSLIAKIEEGYDVVCGWRHKRKDRFFSKKLPSLLSNAFLRLFFKLRIHDSGCSLRAYRKEAVKNIKFFGEMHRFIPLIISNKGFKITEIKVRHAKRLFGKTKYSAKRFMSAVLDLLFFIIITKYSRKPFHILGSLGLVLISSGIFIFLADMVYLLFVLGVPLYKLQVGPLFLISVLLFLFGLNFFILGLLSEILFHPLNTHPQERVY